MCSLREIELFLGRCTQEKSILKALPMNECLKAEPQPHHSIYMDRGKYFAVDAFTRLSCVTNKSHCY